MSTKTATIDPERQMLGEVEVIGRDRWEEIRRRAGEGASIRAIARALDLGRKTVRRCLRQTEWKNGDRLDLSELGRSRGSGLIPGPHPTLEVRFNATRLQWNLASPEVVPVSLRSGTCADDDPFQPSARLLQRCGAEDSRAANVNAHPNVVPARDSAASRLAWRSNRHRPAPPSPRAPDEPSAALELSLDGTPSSVRRQPHRPAQPAVPSREGTPARHGQHRRPARNPPSADRPSLRWVFCFFRRRS